LELRNPGLRIVPAVTKKPKKKDSDMKIDKTTYNKDRKERKVGMTADHTSRPDKVLFFANPHFLFFKSQLTLHTLASRTSRPTNQNLPKSAIFLAHSIIITNFEKK